MNLQTPERIAAAAAEIQRGAVFPLSAEVRLFDPPLYGRRRAVHRVLTAPDDPGLDDELDSFKPAVLQPVGLAGARALRGRRVSTTAPPRTT